MDPWPPNPSIYEINTLVWLGELSRKHGATITLANVPAVEWDAIAQWGHDAVWLMGVWERSPLGVQIAREHPGLQQEYRRALPDYTDNDVAGSPYCIHRYEADARVGGREGLAAARRALAGRGLRLMLDFVPNHTARDHPWVDAHPEYYVQDAPSDSFERDGRRIAMGRDPYFPAWTDVAQLNAFDAGLRQAVLETLLDIASQCDGVRCDMAMLVTNEVFARTWNRTPPQTEYWRGAIAGVQECNPGFLFIAEAYWDMEWKLQQQGFDYCYDKRLYDRLKNGDAASIRAHLGADISYQSRLIRFLENHDEPRAAAAIPGDRHRAAALAVATLPGAKLWHEGQFEGRNIKLPVQLARRFEEPVDQSLRAFYRELLKMRRGGREWRLATEGDDRILAWTWDEAERTVINFSGDAVASMPPWFGQVLKRAFATTA
jgi:glycosidase